MSILKNNCIRIQNGTNGHRQGEERSNIGVVGSNLYDSGGFGNTKISQTTRDLGQNGEADSDYFLESFNHGNPSDGNMNFSCMQQGFGIQRQIHNWHQSAIPMDNPNLLSTVNDQITYLPRPSVYQEHLYEGVASVPAFKPSNNRKSAQYFVDSPCTKKSRTSKKSGRPSGVRGLTGPSLTLAASTNAEKRLKIKNLFRKVATVDLCTDVINYSEGDPETKFVLIQVSTAPKPPLVGGAIPRNVVAEKVKTVTIYGGPNDDDMLRTINYATDALKGGSPETYLVHKVHSIDDVEEHFSSMEDDRKMTQQQLQKRVDTHTELA